MVYLELGVRIRAAGPIKTVSKLSESHNTHTPYCLISILQVLKTLLFDVFNTGASTANLIQ